MRTKRRTTLDGGKKLLTLEMLHTPSRYCCAWMVTVLRDPPTCPPATVTWTLALGTEETWVLCSQPGALLRSTRGSEEPAGGWPLESCLAWRPEDNAVNRVGCGRKEGVAAVGGAAMSGPKVRTGVCSVRSASCLSWFSGVEQTWQLLPPASWFAGVRSCSKRKAAYPGSCRVRRQEKRRSFNLESARTFSSSSAVAFAHK